MRGEPPRRVRPSSPRRSLRASLPRKPPRSRASLIEVLRLPENGRRAFFEAAAPGRAFRRAVEAVRARVEEAFAGSAPLTALGEAIARQLGLDPAATDRSALEALVAKTLMRLGSLPGRPPGIAERDAVERRPDFGPFGTPASAPQAVSRPAAHAMPRSSKALAWSGAVRQVAGPGLGRAAVDIERVAAGVARARKALVPLREANLVTRYGASQAEKWLGPLEARIAAAQEGLTREIAAAGQRFWEGIEGARAELGHVRQELGRANEALVEVVGHAARSVDVLAPAEVTATPDDPEGPPVPGPYSRPCFRLFSISLHW